MKLASRITEKVLSLFSVFSILIVLNGCSDDNGSSGIKVTSFDVEQNGGVLSFTYTTTGDVAYIEIFTSIPPSDGISGPAPVVTSSNGSAEMRSEDLGIQLGDVATFYIRAVGSNNELSAVLGPEVIIISFCDVPTNLHVENGNFSWYYYPSSEFTYYEIEYGPQGFALGNGATMQANGGSTDDLSFVGGQVYDIYLRHYCGVAPGFSSWAGPLSYLAEENQNLCIEPTNVGYNTEYNSLGAPIGVQISWDDLGNAGDYEYNIVGNNQSPTSNALESGNSTTIQYFTLAPGTVYDFYVRTKCNEGTTTQWVGPLNISI